MSSTAHYLIGLAGYAGAGKNTIADALGFRQAAFAAELKNDLRPLLNSRLGLDVDEYRDKSKARELLVAWGKLGRAVNPDYWVTRLAQVVNRQTGDDPIVITDVRYLNEVKHILDYGGIVFFLHRPGVQAANAEEGRSILEIRRAVNDGQFPSGRIIDIDNSGTPRQTADAILARLPYDVQAFVREDGSFTKPLGLGVAGDGSSGGFFGNASSFTRLLRRFACWVWN